MREIHEVVETAASQYQATILQRPDGAIVLDRRIAKSMPEAVLMTLLRRLLIQALD